jgi:hypothetical protein
VGRTDEHHLGAGDEVGPGQLVDGLVPLARVVVEPVPVTRDNSRINIKKIKINKIK